MDTPLSPFSTPTHVGMDGLPPLTLLFTGAAEPGDGGVILGAAAAPTSKEVYWLGCSRFELLFYHHLFFGLCIILVLNGKWDCPPFACVCSVLHAMFFYSTPQAKKPVCLLESGGWGFHSVGFCKQGQLVNLPHIFPHGLLLFSISHIAHPQSIGLIAGAAAAGAVVLIICIVLVAVTLFYWKNKHKEEEEEEIPNEIRFGLSYVMCCLSFCLCLALKAKMP